MAAALPSNILECSICSGDFKIPKFLPCGHTFCLECIDRYIGDKKETFPCPLCTQDITIPVGGAKMFATNYVAQTDSTQHPSSPTQQPSSPTQQPSSPTQLGRRCDTAEAAKESSSTVKYYCSNHSATEIEYYCVNCNISICNRCFILQHNGHEFIGMETEAAKQKARQLVLNSKEFIKNKIENLEKTYAELLEISEKLKHFVEDACSRISKQTERIIEIIKEKSEKVKIEITENGDETEKDLTETREKVKAQIKNFQLDIDSNLPSLTEDSCVQTLASLPKIKHLQQLCETMKDHKIEEVYKYKDWREKNFTVDINMLGSIVKKSYYYQHKLNHFRFNVNDIKEKGTRYYSKDKFNDNDVVWSCYVVNFNNGYLGIFIDVLSSDNPDLDYCIIDRKVSLLNIDDDSKIKTNIGNNKKFDIDDLGWGWDQFISWATFFDKNNGFISSDGEFVVQFDITQDKEISFK